MRRPTLLEASVGGALAGTALAVWPGLTHGHDAFLTPKLVVLAVAALGCAVALWRRGAPAAPTWFDRALALYAVAGLASLVASGRLGARGAGWIALEGAGALVLYASAELASRPGGRRRLRRLVVVVAAAVALLAIAEALGLPLPWSVAPRPVATVGNRNFVAAWAGIALPLALGRLVGAPSAGRAVVVSLLATAVLLARTRSVWLGLAVAAAVLAVAMAVHLLRGRRIPHRRGLALAAAALAVAWVAALLPWPGLQWAEADPLASSARRLVAWDEGSGLERARSAAIAVAALGEDPLLGAGPRAWSDLASRHAHAVGQHADRWGGPPTPSSDLVRVAAESGGLGLLGFVGALALLGAAQVARARHAGATIASRCASPAARPDELALLAALTVAGAHLLLDAPLFRPATLALYMVLAGLARSPGVARASAARTAPLLGLVVALVATAVIGARTVAEIRIASGSDPVRARRAAQRVYPRAEVAAEIVRHLVARGGCAEAAPELADLAREMPGWLGPLEVSRDCARRRGDLPAADRMGAAAVRLEPHLHEMRARSTTERAIWAAAREEGVPGELLLALAWTESRLSARTEARRSQWIRLLAWRPARSPARAAEVLDVPVEALARDPVLAMRGVARILARLAAAQGVAPGAPLAAWWPVLERFNSGGDPLASRLFADQVLAVAIAGFQGIDDDGVRIALPPRGDDWTPAPLHRPAPGWVTGTRGVLYAPAASTAFRPGPATARPVTAIVIHVTENTFSSVLEYFRRPRTEVSSHYLVRASDGFTVQLVDEDRVAFHDACNNDTTIGIEHEGWTAAGDRWFSDRQYRASARLVRDIARRHGIPLDREHIIGHGEAADCSDHTDPGPHWDWDRFMRHVREGDGRAVGAR